MKVAGVIAGLAMLAGAGPAAAEVTASSPQGFQSRTAAHVGATPAKVWAALLQPPRWWSPAHTYSGDAANLSLKTEAGGCFCERLADGGSVQHAQVVQVRPERLLRLSGGLGPLQGEGVAAAWTFSIQAANDGTRVTQTMTVGGWSPAGLDALAAPVDGVLAQQLERLKRLVETGAP